MMYFLALMILISVIIFGVNYKNKMWMPYPFLNWPSWSYGLAILADFSSVFCFLSFNRIYKEIKKDIEDLVLEFPLSTKIRKRRRWKLFKARWPDEISPEESPRSVHYHVQTLNTSSELNDNEGLSENQKN